MEEFIQFREECHFCRGEGLRGGTATHRAFWRNHIFSNVAPYLPRSRADVVVYACERHPIDVNELLAGIPAYSITLDYDYKLPLILVAHNTDLEIALHVLRGVL